MGTCFAIGTNGLRATVWPLWAIFTFVTLKWPSEVIQGQGHCGFWILATKLILVSLSNNGSISHRLGAIGDYSCTWLRSRTRPRKVTQGQRLRCTSTDQDIRNILSIGTHRLRASVYPLWAILTFVTLKWPWKVIQGQRSWRTLTKSAMRNMLLFTPMAYKQRFGRYGRFSLSWPWNYPLKGHPRSRSLRIPNPWGQVPISVP